MPMLPRGPRIWSMARKTRGQGRRCIELKNDGYRRNIQLCKKGPVLDETLTMLSVGTAGYLRRDFFWPCRPLMSSSACSIVTESGDWSFGIDALTDLYFT